MEFRNLKTHSITNFLIQFPHSTSIFTATSIFRFDKSKTKKNKKPTKNDKILLDFFWSSFVLIINQRWINLLVVLNTLFKRLLFYITDDKTINLTVVANKHTPHHIASE